MPAAQRVETIRDGFNRRWLALPLLIGVLPTAVLGCSYAFAEVVPSESAAIAWAVVLYLYVFYALPVAAIADALGDRGLFVSPSGSMVSIVASPLRYALLIASYGLVASLINRIARIRVRKQIAIVRREDLPC